ncbi:MAG: arsenate reductase family protein [Phascolarctobacterium sp.]|nr:arsenate reductase family protein [Phascolarctobacterium sp.]
MLFVCYAKCGTCKKAEKYLLDKGFTLEKRDIKEEKPTLEELKAWYKASGLPLKRFYNTSGKLYKELNLKEKIPTMTEEEQLELLASDGMLVKRPIVVNGEDVLIGFKEAEYAEKGL